MTEPTEAEITEALERRKEWSYAHKDDPRIEWDNDILAAAVERYREALDDFTHARPTRHKQGSKIITGDETSSKVDRADDYPWLRDLKEEMDND